jgi:predicted RNA methylase
LNCCQVQAIDREFGRRTAERDLRRYRRRGPRKTTRLLIEALVKEGVAGRTLLDIGGGVGAIQHVLLAAGAEQVEAVEASQAYLEAA